MREIRVEKVEMSVHLHRRTARGSQQPYLNCNSWLAIRGVADEPVLDVRAYVVSLQADDDEKPWPAYPAAVGGIMQVRPCIRGVVSLPTRAFERAWALASSGQLRYTHLSFTTPKRGAAFIVSASFSNASETEEEGDPPSPSPPVGIS
jgi:hypothetical protein